STIAPEASAYGNTTPQRIWQATWVNTINSRTLFEFGYSAYNSRWGGPTAPGNPTPDFIQVREQGGAIPGLCYRAISTLCGTGFATSTGWISANTWHANISYVTGSHNIKFGYQGLYDYDNQDSNPANSQDLVYSSTTASRTSSGNCRASSRASGARGTTPSSRRTPGRWAG